MEFVSMEDVIQNTISLTRYGKKKINGVRKHGGCDSKLDITYSLKKEKIRKHGGCDSKHDITYKLRKEKNKWSS